MGRQARAKRERREQASYTASLTTCVGTWLEQPPAAAEQARTKAAQQVLQGERLLAREITADTAQAFTESLELFRQAEFAPLHFDDWVIEQVLDEQGEPPVTEQPDDPAFTDYLKRSAAGIATGRLRRAMAEQVRRFIPHYVERGQVREALLIDYNAYLTVMSETVTPLLVQMLVAGLARWYDEHEEEVVSATTGDER